MITIRAGDLVVGELDGNAHRGGNGMRQRVVQGDHELGMVFRHFALAYVEQLAVLLFRKVISEPFSAKQTTNVNAQTVAYAGLCFD